MTYYIRTNNVNLFVDVMRLLKSAYGCTGVTAENYNSYLEKSCICFSPSDPYSYGYCNEQFFKSNPKAYTLIPNIKTLKHFIKTGELKTKLRLG